MGRDLLCRRVWVIHDPSHADRAARHACRVPDPPSMTVLHKTVQSLAQWAEGVSPKGDQGSIEKSTIKHLRTILRDVLVSDMLTHTKRTAFAYRVPNESRSRLVMNKGANKSGSN
jgi:hypothetical protein